MTDIFNQQIIGDGATWMCSTQMGAPQMNGASGSNGQMLQVLDAILVDGFNTQTSTGVEIMPDGFVKIKFGTSTDYRRRQKILVEGANDANLNGTHIITSLIGNDVVIKAPDVSLATGAINTKIAPLGWESIFGNTNALKRAYRSKNPDSTQTVLYLDMSLPSGNGYDTLNPAKRAMVSICDDMVDIGVQINSYTDGLNNYGANINGSLFWHQARGLSKSNPVTTSVNSRWTVIGNGDYFYFVTEWIDYQTTRGTGYRDFYCFGDMPSLAGAGDEWNCSFAGAFTPNDNDPNRGSFNGASVGANNSKFFISRFNGIGAMIPFSFTSGGGVYVSGKLAGIDFPNPTTQSIVCNSLYSLSSGSVRTIMPRIMSIQHVIGNDFAMYENALIDDVLIVPLAGGTGTDTANTNGYFAFNMGD